MGNMELTPTHDIYIAEAFPDRNFNGANALFVGRYQKAGDIYRSLLIFDLTSINSKAAPGFEVKSAYLKINIFRNEVPSEPGKAYIGVYRLVEDFDKDAATWNTQPDSAPYPAGAAVVNKRFTGSLEIDVTRLVKGWADGTFRNLGMVLKGSEDINGIIASGSSRASDASLHPRLVINFSGNAREGGDLKTFWGLYNYRSSIYRSQLNSPLPRESEEIISKIKYKNYKGIVVYPEAVFWEPIQRPQQILRELAKKGYLCFFCDPPKGDFNIREIKENLFIVNNEAYLLPVLRCKFVIVLCSWLMQMAWADLLPNKFVWYDILDKIESFTMYDDGMAEKHETQIREADFLSYSSKLLKRYVSKRNDAVYLPNGCNFDDFTKIEDTEIPKSMKSILEIKKPIIGYFGVVEKWFDDYLVSSLAARNPDWQFVIIGKTNINKKRLKALNIHLLGMIPYNELPKYARHFNVAIIPFKVNDLTNCVSPVKFFEYASLGKPVVSTPIMEMKQYKNKWVHLARNVDTFERKIKVCLSDHVQNTSMDKGVEFASENQWSSRVETFEKELRTNPKGWLAFSNIYNTGTVAAMAATFLDYDGKNFYSGGAERYLIDLAGICANLGLSMSVYQYGNFPWTRRFRNIDIYSLSTGDFDAKIFSSENLSRFNRIFYEYVEGRTLLNIYSAFFEGYPYNAKPSIGISHGVAWDSPFYCMFSNGRSSWDNQKRFIEAAKLCDLMISVDTNTPNWFQTIIFSLGSRMAYIPNYVDIKEFVHRKNFDVTRKKTVILYPRRLYEARGFQMVVEIMDSILQRYSDVEFHFVGRGIEKDTKLVVEKQEKWGDRVKWYSKMPEEMPEVYKDGDITLIPTVYSEGTSLSCLEAMSAGNAVIATRIGGLTNLIINNYNGYLIEPDGKALLSALESLLNNPDRLMDFKKKSIEVARAFSKEAWENKWTNIIKDTIGKTEACKITNGHLVEIYISSLSDWPIDHLGVLITELLIKDCLVYIRVKNTNGFKTISYGRSQWVPWDEEDITKPDLVISDEKVLECVKETKTISFVLTKSWLENLRLKPDECGKLLGIE